MARTFKTLLGAAAVALVAASGAHAANINILWTSGNNNYNSRITQLAAQAPFFDPSGDGALDWTVTFWDDTVVTTPQFENYDVLVIGTSDAGFGTGVSFGGVLSNKDPIAAARGSRTFLSGQDADYHFVRNSPSRPDVAGFMINAVNWAASGTGLGIVSMPDGWAGTGSRWWLNDNSFLKDELDGYATYFQSESVIIGNGQGDFPVNEGLSSAGLSNWGTSSHAGFNGPVPGYTTINYEGSNNSGRAITIVTEGLAGGGTDGDKTQDQASVIPLPASGWMLLAGVAALVRARRRRA